MNWWQGVVLGLVQGLTEFLPVSSSGHLALVEALTGVKTPGLFVEVSLHVATLGSVLLVYGGRLWRIVAGVLQGRREDLQYAGYLILGTIPAALVGVLLHRVLEERFHALQYVGIGFFLTGVVLWSTRRLNGTGTRPTAGGALVVGGGQAAAVLLHMSRSGSTVSAALWSGLGRAAAAEFSFLLSIPAILGAAVIEGRHMSVDIATVGVLPLVVACAVALASGVFAIRFLVALIVQGRFYAFAPYCWAVGVFTIVYALWHH